MLSVLEVPWGWLGSACSERGLTGLTLPKATAALAWEEISCDFPDGKLGQGPHIEDVQSQLTRFFKGEPISFDIALDLPKLPAFWRKVWGIVAGIPYGETRSYGRVAREAGAPGAARAVGGAMANNPVPIIIPCHRVVGSNGSLTGFGGGLAMKQKLLDMERSGQRRPIVTEG